MRSRLLAFLVIVALFPLAAPAQGTKENPYKNAKVGDYVSYRMSTSAGGKEFNIDIKQIVTAKDDKEVSLKTTTSFNGKELPGQTTKVDLTKPFDPASSVLQGKKGTFEKKDEGKEKVKVGDKAYDCTWISGKVVAEFKGNKLESDVKFWVSKSVPLSGLVKMEMKSDFANVRMELTGSGSEK
ncbi:MAG TPA: hypothetical protein VFE62_04045 [Gemmataceae bacterium]|nr:hypothetical protein [Gemmataceae bacterium]